MTPLALYQAEVDKGHITSDPNQITAMNILDRLYADLMEAHERRASLFSFLKKTKSIQGVYLWGGVGIGKTFMMDCFFNSLPFPQKMRMHFHGFMQMIHNALKKHQGESDPLKIIASEIAKKTEVLCFDELFVSDITDAMILGRLFKALFACGITLVATSNNAPDNLYLNGLQRLNFLPVIAMLKEKMEVVAMPSLIDYRLRHLKEAGVFYTPLDEQAEINMEKAFHALTNAEGISTDPILILDRYIPVKKRTQDVVWFHFEDICHVPRSQMDYLSISTLYKTVFVDNIPVIDASEKDTICLFIGLIDVLYDARVRLVFSAAEPVEQLYHRGYMIAEFTRTHSRLLEMQSQDYFTQQD